MKAGERSRGVGISTKNKTMTKTTTRTEFTSEERRQRWQSPGHDGVGLATTTAQRQGQGQGQRQGRVKGQRQGRPPLTAAPSPFRRGIDLGCSLGLLGLAFQYLCAHMSGIDLSTKMVDREAERGCYNVLAVGNAESVFILPSYPPRRILLPLLTPPATLTSRSRWSASTPTEAEAEMETANAEEDEEEYRKRIKKTTTVEEE